MSNRDQVWELEPYITGRLRIPLWECFMGTNDCTMRDIVFWVTVLRKGDSVGLVDSGLPVAQDDLNALNEACQAVDPESYFRDVMTLPDILEAADLRPDDIDFVLITQSINYCTGGLDSSLLPRAEIYMARAGIEEFLYDNPGHPARDMYFTESTWSYLFEAIKENRFIGVADEVAVAEGLTFAHTGGHHPGSAAVIVERPGGPIALMETAFVQENIDRDIPIGIAESAAIARQAVRSYKARGITPLAYHEPSLDQLIAQH